MEQQRSKTPLLELGVFTAVGLIVYYLYNSTGQLSEHFSKKDLIRSATAKRLGIEEQNHPPKHIVKKGRRLARNVLQPVRDELGYPIFVNSWWRHPLTNKAVGGVKDSDHEDAEGVDLRTVIDGVFRNDLIAKAVITSKVPFTQLILEEGTLQRPKWIHVARRGNDNSRQILYKDSAGNYSTLTEANILAL